MSDAQTELEFVRSRIRDAATDRETLTLLFIRLLHLERPRWRFEMASDEELSVLKPNGEATSIYLRNFWVECEQTPDDRLEIAERRIRILAPDATVSEEVQAGQIVPLIRDTTYREFLAETERDLISAHLAGDIWIVYACDLADSMTSLMADDAKRLALDAQALRKISVENLSRLMEGIEAHSYENFYEISCIPFFYASSLLLLDHVWEQLGHLVNGQLVVAVPARDTVIFTRSGDTEALPKLREAVDFVLANGHHLISGTLLRRVNGGWEAFS